MSGIEVAGLVLGAIPLLISAMEHFEETRKVARDWWKIRRAHRKDVGKLRDCEMKFQLNMRELLQPLLLDGTISEEDYATFLGSTSNSGWERPDVQESLAERLSDCRDRYLEKLDEMNELLVRLAKATLVDDEKFQSGIKKHKGTGVSIGRKDEKEQQLTDQSRAQSRRVSRDLYRQQIVTWHLS